MDAPEEPHSVPPEKNDPNAAHPPFDPISPPSMKKRRTSSCAHEIPCRGDDHVKDEEDDDDEEENEEEDDDEEDDDDDEDEDEEVDNRNARLADCDADSRNENNVASDQDPVKSSFSPLSSDNKMKTRDSLETGVAGIRESVPEATKIHRENSTSKRPSANGDGTIKRPKKKPVNVWAKASSRKGGKKSSKMSGKNEKQRNSKSSSQSTKENCVYLIPAKNQAKIEDGPGMPVLLSKFHKSERIELSEDRLTAGSTKGYRMVRATRGVTGGAWYFEITIENLGKTGHTRLGWSTQKGELQAPVGFDTYSYGYRDIDGSKVHMAIREPYGEPYVEGDVIGFYINLPNGDELAPKPASVVSYKGHPYIIEEKEEPQQIVPDSEISFYRNGVYQGGAFKGIIAGRYFPAASMYTLPNESNCTVRFNFGPDFRFPVIETGDDRPIPQALTFAPPCSLDSDSASANGFQDVNVSKALNT